MNSFIAADAQKHDFRHFADELSSHSTAYDDRSQVTSAEVILSFSSVRGLLDHSQFPLCNDASLISFQLTFPLSSLSVDELPMGCQISIRYIFIPSFSIKPIR